MVGLLFPGQGSQFVGMGRDLAEEIPAARQVFEEADEALGFRLSRIAWDGPEADLTATKNAQPAILTHSIAAFRVVQDALGEIALAAGHSLGEFSAYVAGGALTLADGVRTVRLRGELMYRGGQERPGAMAAILGLDDDEVVRVCREASDAAGECVPANFNSPAQVVVSGDIEAVKRTIELAKAAGAKRAIPLNVSGAFHSQLMEVAVSGLREQLESVPFTRPAFPIVSNVTAEPVSDPAEGRSLLVRQLTSPVRWTDCVRAMAAAGVTRFVEVGPGSVLAGLMRRIERGAEVATVGKVDEARAMVGG